MTQPVFLIIGAMKAGTTTLYRDLMTHPRLFFPLDKEPMNLADDRVLTPEGLAEYEAMFAAAGEGRLCGEASTGYTKLPVYPGVPARALRVLGARAKLVYLMRHPVQRTVSHHFHLYSQGRAPRDIDAAIAQLPDLVDFSLYGMQLRPWLEAFGRDALLPVRFEDYVADRRDGAARVMAFLGVEPDASGVNAAAVFNRSEGKPVTRGGWTRVIGSPIYRRTLRHVLPPGVRDWGRRLLLPSAPPRPDPPSPTTVERLVGRFRQDHRLLRDLLGDDAPAWDMERSFTATQEQD